MRSKQETAIEPQSPIDFRFAIPEDVDYVVLSLESADDLCMTVSSFDGNCTAGGVPVQRISADRKERETNQLLTKTFSLFRPLFYTQELSHTSCSLLFIDEVSNSLLYAKI